MHARVQNLRKHLEQLFPGKWLSGNERTRNLQTGVPEIDQGISRGIARRRITEWIGSVSSGKTTLLRNAISNWCAAGLNVAYIDTEGRLLASDWAYIDQGQGKFWIVRPPDANTISAPSNQVLPLISKRSLYSQEATWSADQFIRSNAFDVVILDFGAIDPSDQRRRGMSYSPVSSSVYARLQRSLDRSKAALIIVRDAFGSADASASWGCYSRFTFDRGTSIKCEPGLAGIAMITPTIGCRVERDGMNQSLEVTTNSSIQNRLFTHPQVADRRIPKRQKR
jgi:nicotinamide riboside kinase